MKASRLDGLVDGIFAIVMTLLIIEIRVPEFHENTTNIELWQSLTHLGPLCLSYILSFSLLFTYWRAHAYVISNAKSFNPKLTNYNALFLFFIGLIPFTTHLLGKYGYTQLAVILYGLNIILIGISLYQMKIYIQKYNHHDEMQMTTKSIRHANIRLLVPVFCAIVAVGLCFLSTNLSLILFTILIIFNLTQKGADLVDYLIGKGGKEVNIESMLPPDSEQFKPAILNERSHGIFQNKLCDDRRKIQVENLFPLVSFKMKRPI